MFLSRSHVLFPSHITPQSYIKPFPFLFSVSHTPLQPSPNTFTTDLLPQQHIFKYIHVSSFLSEWCMYVTIQTK